MNDAGKGLKGKENIIKELQCEEVDSNPPPLTHFCENQLQKDSSAYDTEFNWF